MEITKILSVVLIVSLLIAAVVLAVAGVNNRQEKMEREYLKGLSLIEIDQLVEGIEVLENLNGYKDSEEVIRSAKDEIRTVLADYYGFAERYH